MSKSFEQKMRDFDEVAFIGTCKCDVEFTWKYPQGQSSAIVVEQTCEHGVDDLFLNWEERIVV